MVYNNMHMIRIILAFNKVLACNVKTRNVLVLFVLNNPIKSK